MKGGWKERSEAGKKWRRTEMKSKEGRERKVSGKGREEYEEKEEEGKVRE